MKAKFENLNGFLKEKKGKIGGFPPIMESMVIGNECADTLAGQALINGELTLDPPTVLANVNEFLLMHEPLTNSYTLDALKEKGIKRERYQTRL